MSQKKEAYKVRSTHSAFFTGGDIEWTKDGELLCQCGSQINVVDINDGKVTSSIGEEVEGRMKEPDLEVPDDEDSILTFGLSPDNTTIVVAHRSGLLRTWNWKENKLVKLWRSLHKVPISRLAISEDGSSLATGSTDASIRLWNLEQHVCTHNLLISEIVGVISILKYNKRRLYAAADDAAIRSFNADSGTLMKTYKGHYSKVTGLIVLDETNRMISCGRDKVVILWDLQSANPLKTLAMYEALEALAVLPYSISLPGCKKLSEDGIYIACAGEKGVVRVWDAEQAKELYAQNESLVVKSSEGDGQGILKLLFCPAKNGLAAVYSDHTIVCLSTDDDLAISKQLVGFSDEILDVALLGEGHPYLAVATNSPNIKLYTVATMNCHLLKGHSDLVISLANTPANPNLLVSGSKDNSIRIWLLNAEGIGTCVASGTRHTSSVTAIALGYNNPKLLVSSSTDTTLKMWMLPKKYNTDGFVESLSAKLTVLAHDQDVNGVCIAPNDKIIATASRDKTAKLWNASDLSLLGVLRGHRRGVWAVKFSPSDQVLATTSADATLRLWSLSDLSCLKTFEGHGSSVLRVEFLHRGMQLVSVGSDGLLKLWSIKSGECVATFDEHDGKVWGLAVSRDESELVTGGDDSKLLFWVDVTEEVQIEAANLRQENAESEQRLSNLIHDKRLLPALELALTLDRPATVLKIISNVQRESKDALESAIRQLDVDKKSSLLKCANVWNANSKHANAAQVVISVLLDDVTKGDLHLPQALLESIMVYSERHYKRLTQLQQDLHILKYTANAMLPYAK